MDIVWADKIINVDRADMSVVQSTPTYIYELDINWFRLKLGELEATVEGMAFERAHKHNTEVVLGGITYARIVEIVNGYTVTFENGTYAVNLARANSNIGTVTNVNGVSIRSANSAGMTSSPDIEFSSFNGGVTYDEDNGVSGTIFPIGTPRMPVNNVADAMAIASARGFFQVFVHGNATWGSGVAFDHFTIIGNGKNRSVITINAAAAEHDRSYENCHFLGVFDGGGALRHCVISDMTYLAGYVETTMLAAGRLLLGSSGVAHFLNCFSGVPGTGTAIVDMAGDGAGLAMRGYNGGIMLTNKTGNTSVSIDLGSGQVKLDLSGAFGAAGVTNGQVVVRGSGKVIDASTNEHLPSGMYGSLQLVNETVNKEGVAREVWGYER